MHEDYKNILDELKSHSHFRDLKNFEAKDEKFIYYKGKKLLNLSSNNYLNFADNKKIFSAHFATKSEDTDTLQIDPTGSHRNKFPSKTCQIYLK